LTRHTAAAGRPDGGPDLPAGMSPNAPHRDFACASAAFFRDDSAEKPTIREFPGIATLVRPCL